MQPFQGSGATSNLGRRKASDSSWAGKDAECNAIFPGRHGGEPYDDAVDDAKERLLPQSLPIPPHQEEVARQLTQRQDKRRSVCVDQQTTHLERLFRKCDQSWDKVLLHVVAHMLRTDSTDTTARNNDGDIPVVLALSNRHDAVAAKILESMKPADVRNVFQAHDHKDCDFSFHDLVEHKGMKESLTRALDSMMERSHTQPDTVTVYLQILDGDRNGRAPDNHRFDGNRTILQLIAKGENKDAVCHDVVRLLIWYKWKKFVAKRYWSQAAIFVLYVIAMSMALIFAGGADDPNQYRSGLDIFRGVCEVLAILFCLYGLVEQVHNMYKYRSDYFEDLYNYADLASFFMLLVIIPLRYADSSSQWTVASFAYITTCLRFFKYTCAFREIGAYTQIMVQIVRFAILRFIVVFCIFLVTFSGSFYLALRGEEDEMFSLKENRTLTISDLDKPEYYHARSYPEILLTGMRILIERGPILDYYGKSSKLGWLGIVLIVFFMFIVIVVLLSILVAQLTDTYRSVQSDAQKEVDLNRAYIAGEMEKNGLLRKDLLARNYEPSINVRDPAVAKHWESSQTNENRQLQTISNRLEQCDNSLLSVEQNQSSQNKLLKDLNTRVEKLLKEVKDSRRKQQCSCQERKGHATDTDQSDSSRSSSDVSETDKARSPLGVKSEDVQYDQQGGGAQMNYEVSSASAQISPAAPVPVAMSYDTDVSAILPEYAAQHSIPSTKKFKRRGSAPSHHSTPVSVGDSGRRWHSTTQHPFRSKR
ncbi:uncharacterized protein LOC135809062 isoform X2 [Sycon ciliatum]|uniref:uncharacterized protein LOC135809062 isoform X2 n=1 Tax=Sycon ciliatum TaxID=27933 RepID=UPI0031F6BBD7